jgi:hypothetical protein
MVADERNCAASQRRKVSNDEGQEHQGLSLDRKQIVVAPLVALVYSR